MSRNFPVEESGNEGVSVLMAADMIQNTRTEESLANPTVSFLAGTECVPRFGG